MKKSILCSIVLLYLLPTISFAQSKQLKKLAGWMAGSFTTTLQSKKDTSYFDIRLQIIPIWKTRTDGYWFYVEQAVAGFTDKPYRQRVYHLTEKPNGTFESEVYTLTDPLRFTHQPGLVEKLTTDSLSLRDGCTVVLTAKDPAHFEGGTVGTHCPSERRGATYATSEVTITSKQLRSWDRGFDANNTQVWGAEKGGYIFIKKKRF